MCLLTRLRKRPVLLLGLLAVALLLGSGGVLLWANRPTHRINPESFQKLQLGMRRAEAEQMLGGPPGDYAKHMGSLIPSPMLSGNIQFIRHYEFWHAEDYTIMVSFDRNGRVAVKSDEHARRLKRSWFNQLRHLLQL